MTRENTTGPIPDSLAGQVTARTSCVMGQRNSAGMSTPHILCASRAPARIRQASVKGRASASAISSAMRTARLCPSVPYTMAISAGAFAKVSRRACASWERTRAFCNIGFDALDRCPQRGETDAPMRRPLGALAACAGYYLFIDRLLARDAPTASPVRMTSMLRGGGRGASSCGIGNTPSS